MGGSAIKKKWCDSLKVFLCPLLQLRFRSYVSLEALIILQWVIIKHIQEAIGASEIGPKRRDRKHYNYTNFPTRYFITTCVFMCKSQCSSRLKLQLLTFSNCFNMMWYLWTPLYRRKFLSFLCHSLSLFSEKWGRGRKRWFWGKNDKFNMEKNSIEVQRKLFWEKPPFWMAPMWKFWKKSVYLIHKP